MSQLQMIFVWAGTQQPYFSAAMRQTITITIRGKPAKNTKSLHLLHMGRQLGTKCRLHTCTPREVDSIKSKNQRVCYETNGKKTLIPSRHCLHGRNVVLAASACHLVATYLHGRRSCRRRKNLPHPSLLGSPCWHWNQEKGERVTSSKSPEIAAQNRFANPGQDGT